MISPELTTELKEILLKKLGREVTMAEADRFGNALVKYFSLLTKMNKEGKKASE